MNLVLVNRPIIAPNDTTVPIPNVRSVRRNWLGGHCELVEIELTITGHADVDAPRTTIQAHFNDVPVPCVMDGEDVVLSPTLGQRLHRLAAQFGFGQATITIVYATEY